MTDVAFGVLMPIARKGAPVHWAISSNIICRITFTSKYLPSVDFTALGSPGASAEAGKVTNVKAFQPAKLFPSRYFSSRLFY
jgi:hypothetical protein